MENKFKIVKDGTKYFIKALNKENENLPNLGRRYKTLEEAKEYLSWFKALAPSWNSKGYHNTGRSID